MGTARIQRAARGKAGSPRAAASAAPAGKKPAKGGARGARARAGAKAANAEPSTIGVNPLDQLVSGAAVRQISGRRALELVAAPAVVPPPGPGPAVKLAITVPQALSDQVQALLSLRSDLSFDQLMSTALAEVVQSLRGGAYRGRGAIVSSIKDLAKGVAPKR